MSTNPASPAHGSVSDVNAADVANTAAAAPSASAGMGARSGAEPYSDSDSWYITVPECRSATISAVLGADDLATLSVGNLSLELGPRG